MARIGTELQCSWQKVNQQSLADSKFQSLRSFLSALVLLLPLPLTICKPCCYYTPTLEIPKHGLRRHTDKMALDVFSVPVFLIVFRETLETSIIVSVLLAFLKLSLNGPDGADKTAYKKLTRQVKHPTFSPFPPSIPSCTYHCMHQQRAETDMG